MRVRLLGTGASNGWPDPWCGCRSCAAAADQGVLRGQTGVLVDDRLLLDLGPELPRAALRQGTSLVGVDTILVTHVHEDHFAPAALMWRGWQDGLAPLTLAAPPAVLAVAAERIDPTVVTIEAVAGKAFTTGAYAVLPLPATHGPAEIGPAVLYDVTGPDGTRLLYATDTGVLSDEAMSLAAGRAYDLVLLELTTSGHASHLDLTTWPQQVARLREVGAITDATQVVAVHLGHGNPAPHVLDGLLRGWGARAGRDGEVIVLGAAPARRVLVLGGARSGKSVYAESLLDGPATYVATAPARPGDDEWSARVAAHVLRRPPSWQTLETGDVAGVLLAAEGPLLIDDLGLWLARLLDDHDAWDEPGAVFSAALEELDTAWREAASTVVLVAPEVGGGVVPEHRSGRLFRDLLGTATQRLAATADEVVQVVAGLPRRIR